MRCRRTAKSVFPIAGAAGTWQLSQSYGTIGCFRDNWRSFGDDEHVDDENAYPGLGSDRRRDRRSRLRHHASFAARICGGELLSRNSGCLFEARI